MPSEIPSDPTSPASESSASAVTPPTHTDPSSQPPTQGTATFYLTGIRLDGRHDRPNLYTFLIEQSGTEQNGTEQNGIKQESLMLPLIHDGQIILFTDLALAQTALKAAHIDVEFRNLSLQNVYLIDVSQTLFLLQSQSVDEQKIIANTLDFFARVLTALGIGVPPVFADALIAFGNYIDQNTFYGDFIEQKSITRHRCIDATRWCLGTVLSLTKLITE